MYLSNVLGWTTLKHRHKEIRSQKKETKLQEYETKFASGCITKSELCYS